MLVVMDRRQPSIVFAREYSTSCTKCISICTYNKLESGFRLCQAEDETEEQRQMAETAGER